MTKEERAKKGREPERAEGVSTAVLRAAAPRSCCGSREQGPSTHVSATMLTSWEKGVARLSGGEGGLVAGVRPNSDARGGGRALSIRPLPRRCTRSGNALAGKFSAPTKSSGPVSIARPSPCPSLDRATAPHARPSGAYSSQQQPAAVGLGVRERLAADSQQAACSSSCPPAGPARCKSNGTARRRACCCFARARRESPTDGCAARRLLLPVCFLSATPCERRKRPQTARRRVQLALARRACFLGDARRGGRVTEGPPGAERAWGWV